MLLDFDAIEEWHGDLSQALSDLLPPDLQQTIVASRPQYVEDARELVLASGRREDIIDRTLAWIESNTVLGYHGTRLTKGELGSLLKNGIRPLSAPDRRDRLQRALSKHPKWAQEGSRLDFEMEQNARHRTGQVHLTLSRSGLVDDFNHYIIAGSEFDQRVAFALLGSEGEKLLREDGEPLVVKVGVPGKEAITAAHPYFTVDDMRRRGDLPNLVGEFLASWAYRVGDRTFQPGRICVDCGLVFFSPVPPEWILATQPIVIGTSLTAGS